MGTPIQDITTFQTNAAIFNSFLTDDANTEVDFSQAQDGSDMRPSLAMLLANMGTHPAAGGWCDAAQVENLPAYTYANGASGVDATITANANGALSAAVIDGVAPLANMRVWLSIGAGAHIAAGIYVLTQVGDAGTPFIFTRATDADSAEELGFLFAAITGGNTQAGLVFLISNNGADIVVGTTALATLVLPAPPGVAAAVAVETARAEAAEQALQNGLRSCENSSNANFTLDATADFWPVNAGGGAIVATVPAGAGFANQEWTVKKTDGSGNAVTLQLQAGETLDGANTFVLHNQYAAVTFRNKRGSTSWFIKSLYLN